MKSFPMLDWLDKSLDQLKILHLEENPDAHFQKYFIAGNLVVIPFMIFMLILSLKFDVPVLIYYSTGLLVFYIINMTIFRQFISPHYLIFIQKTLTVIVTIYFVYRMGGIMNSGGIILIGIAAVTHTIIFHNYKWMLFAFGVFFLGIIILSFAPNPFAAYPILTPKLNSYFFTITLIGVTGYVFLFALYALNLYSQLEKKQTLHQKELNEAKSRLYTNITHEFRTPLTVILGIVDALKSEKVSDIPVAYEKIRQNGNKLLSLVEQLISFNKLESGKLKVNIIHGNIIPFINYLFQLHEPLAEKKNLNYSMNSDQQSFILDYDPDKISMIISNLLSNAIKFTPENGNVMLNVKIKNQALIFSIIDSGIGIQQQNIEKIFDRFYMIDDQNTRSHDGAGIGLALTKEIIQLLNGSIKVKSDPGVKTIFTVKLPVINLEEFKSPEIINNSKSINLLTENHIAEDNMPAHHDKQRLLVIEDNKDIVDFLKLYYGESYQVLWAEDGLKGFVIAVDQIPDIIISDIMMPGMDGFELCGRLKSDFRTSHIPVILLTARADYASRIQGLEKGADAYLVKPFNQHELNTRIQKLLQLRQTLQKKYAFGFHLNEYNANQDREDQFMQRLTKTIMEHLDEETYDISKLCRDIGMSKSQLYRKYKALTNDSVARYIKQIRMQKALQLVEYGDMSIAEIGEAVGIKSPATFSRMFKEEFGESPSAHMLQLESINHNQGF